MVLIWKNMSLSLVWVISQSYSPCFRYHFPSCLSFFPVNYEAYIHNKHKHVSFLLLILSSGYNRCFLVGHDWGGIIAWLCAIHYPEMVTKLIVLNSPHPCVFTGKSSIHLTNRLPVQIYQFQRLCLVLRAH